MHLPNPGQHANLGPGHGQSEDSHTGCSCCPPNSSHGQLNTGNVIDNALGVECPSEDTDHIDDHARTDDIPTSPSYNTSAGVWGGGGWSLGAVLLYRFQLDVGRGGTAGWGGGPDGQVGGQEGAGDWR